MPEFQEEVAVETTETTILEETSRTEPVELKPFAAVDDMPKVTLDINCPDDVMALYDTDAATKMADRITSEINAKTLDNIDLLGYDFGFILPAVNYAGNIANYRQWPKLSTADAFSELAKDEQAETYFSKILATTGYFVVVSTHENCLVDWADTIELETAIGTIAATAVGRFDYSYGELTMTAVAYMFSPAMTRDSKVANKVATIKKSQLKAQLLHYNAVFSQIPQAAIDAIIDGAFSNNYVLFEALSPGLFTQVIRRRASHDEKVFDADKNCRLRFNNSDTNLTNAQINEATTYYDLMGIKMTGYQLRARVQLVRLRAWLYSQREVQEALSKSRARK